jgi:hypothetical protein
LLKTSATILGTNNNREDKKKWWWVGWGGGWIIHTCEVIVINIVSK